MTKTVETTFRDRYRGCLLGLAVGDVVGTTPWVSASRVAEDAIKMQQDALGTH